MMTAGQHAGWRLVWVIAMVVALAGCQSTQGWADSYYTGDFDGSGTSSGAQSGQDEAEFFSASGVQACAVGATLGALACLFVSGEDRASCMALAASAGCVVGSTANYVVDDRRAQRANEEQRMRAHIRDVEADSRLLAQRISTYEVVLKDNREELRRIQEDIRVKRGDKRTRRAQLAEIQASRKIMLDELSDLDQKIARYREIARNDDAPVDQKRDFQSALRSLENERNDLQRLIEQTYQDLPAIVASS